MQWSHTWQNHPAARAVLDALSTGGRAAFYAGNIQRGVQIGTAAMGFPYGSALGAAGGFAVSVGTEMGIECGIERGIDAAVARGMDEAQVLILAEVTGNYLQIFGSVRAGSGRVKRVRFNQQTLQSLYQSFLPQYAAAGPYNQLSLLPPPPPAKNPRPTPAGARTSAFAGRTPKSGGNVSDQANLGHKLKGPYNPRATYEDLKAQYPGKVTSSTIPETKNPNVKLAGKAHPETGIVFDERGLPIFDKYVIVNINLPREIVKIKNPNLHMKEATKQLRELIEKGSVQKSLFTDLEIDQINAGKARIKGFVWHHHQDIGRMQLVSRKVPCENIKSGACLGQEKTIDLHQKTAHVGGFDLWYKGADQ